tara:strand:- start:1516 stop:2538 length:1023 start_codon:yes stop_codon:yes gene_type:complete
MFNIYFLFFLPFIIFFLNQLIKNKNLIPNYSGSKHQKLFNNLNIPLSGGVFVFLILFMIYVKVSLMFLIFSFLIFFLGLLADINLLSSPRWRFLLQITLVFSFVYFSELNILSIRIAVIDFYLQNFLISCIFTSFCLMILINGTNFIDGLNGLVLSYYLIISFFIYKLQLFDFFYLGNLDYLVFIFTLIYLLIFNFLNKLYLGDSGSYLLGLAYGYFLILIFQNNNFISPYFIALLLWYPAFETFFSILRKLILKKSPTDADNIHFHQLLFHYIKIKLKFKNVISNNFSSLLIIFYNILIFFISSQMIENSSYQLSLIIFNIGIYLLIYFNLYKFKKKNN